MIFMRYIGVEKRFTEGKVYLGRPEMNGSETVSFSFVETRDDAGEKVRVKPGRSEWEYLSEVYAVVAKPVSNLEMGEVVMVDDSSDDGDLFRVEGESFFRASHFILLDKTNVFPGLYVMDGVTGCWVKVVKVDGCLWMATADDQDVRPPSDYRFAVEDGDILTEPFVVCQDATGQANLTMGRSYRVTRNMPDGTVEVYDDSGEKVAYMKSRFEMTF